MALGIVRMHFDWDWKGAEQEFQRALRLNPRFLGTYGWYAWYLICMGRNDEAIEISKQSVQMAPRSATENGQLAYNLCSAQRYEEARQQALLTLELDPKDSQSLQVICHYYEAKKDYKSAIQAAEKLQTIDDEIFATTLIGCYHGWSGNRNEAMRRIDSLKELSKSRHIRAEYYSFIHAALGENDLALDGLEKAVEDRSPGVVYLKIITTYDPLRSHPRFQAILKKMNLPP